MDSEQVSVSDNVFAYRHNESSTYTYTYSLTLSHSSISPSFISLSLSVLSALARYVQTYKETDTRWDTHTHFFFINTLFYICTCKASALVAGGLLLSNVDTVISMSMCCPGCICLVGFGLLTAGWMASGWILLLRGIISVGTWHSSTHKWSRAKYVFYWLVKTHCITWRQDAQSSGTPQCLSLCSSAVVKSMYLLFWAYCHVPPTHLCMLCLG